MSKQSKKNKKSQPGSIQKNPKHVFKKLKLKFKQGKTRKKMSDLSSEASSVRSLVASEKSGFAASRPSLGSNRKLQCDLCKLSYSSDKDLKEHLVSLMHHTKLENKDENSVHNCVLCKVECKDMADYRKHIGLSSHLEEIALLKEEKRRPKQSKWGPKIYEGERHQFRGGKQFNSNKFNSGFYNKSVNSVPWNYNKNQERCKNLRYQAPPLDNFWSGQEEGINESSFDGYGTVFSYQDFFMDFNIYPRENNTHDWISGSHMGSGGKNCEPWGSAMYRNRYGPPKPESHLQYDRRGYYQNKRDFHGPRFFENSQSGHWDEHSLSEQEKFLASIDENNEGRDKFNWKRVNISTGVDVDNQRVSDSVRWGSGTKNKIHTPSSAKDVQDQQVLDTSVQPVMDRKRPMQDDELKDACGSAAPKTFCSRVSLHNDKPPMQDGHAPVKQRQINTSSTSTAATDKLDNASDDLLQRAERLCKELRERRMASSQVNSNKVKTKHATLLSQKLDAISQQRQQKYFKGIIKDLQDVSSADSGISTSGMSQDAKKYNHRKFLSESSKVDPSPSLSSGKQKSLGEIRKSLEETVQISEDKEPEVSKKRQKTDEKTCSYGFPNIPSDVISPTLNKQGLAVSQRERRDSSSSTGSKQSLKAVVRPQILTKDSLKKIINAPRSRDERVQLAKLLHSRDDAHHKTAVGTGTSRPLQLEGLYDSQCLDLDAATGAASSGDVTNTIKLEDLGGEVREKILSLIGSSCPGLEELQLPVPDSQTQFSAHQTMSDEEETTVLSSTQGFLSLGKKQGNVSMGKKKSDVDTDSIKKKAKKKAAVGLKNSTAKDDKNTSTDSLNTDCDKVIKKKPKFPSSEIIIVNLIDSEEEFQSSKTVSKHDLDPTTGSQEMKGRTPNKQKKIKKKDEAKAGHGIQSRSSLESDDILNGVHLSSKKQRSQESLPQTSSHIDGTVLCLCSSKSSAKLPTSKKKTSLGSGTYLDKETSKESLPEICSLTHGTVRTLKSAEKLPASKRKISGGNGTDCEKKTTKDSLQEICSNVNGTLQRVKSSEKLSTSKRNLSLGTEIGFDKESSKDALPDNDSHVHGTVINLSTSNVSEKLSTSKGKTNQETGSNFDKEANIHGTALNLSGTKALEKVLTSSGKNFKSKKSKAAEELSLNSQNVKEKYPLLMKSSPYRILTSSSSLSPPTTTVVSSTRNQAPASSDIYSSNPSTVARPYAKAVAVSSSVSSSCSAPSTSIAPLSSVSLAQINPAHTVNLQLPPSIHLANRQSQPEAIPAPVEAVSEDIKINWTKSEGETKDEQSGLKETSVVVMDDSDDAVSGEDNNPTLSSSTYAGEASNQAMTELLLLSEREEQMKQEAMSMELRLTRLHRLLEQAVVQINKCTERRAQLQEEEKEISNKRLSLLRGAAKCKTSDTSSTSLSLNQSSAISSIETRHAEPAIDSISLGKLATASLSSSHSSALTTSSKSPTKSSLSKADWLAKFSSFLPPDPTRENTKSAPDTDLQQNQKLSNFVQKSQESMQLSHTQDTEDPPNEARDEIYCGISSSSSRGSESGKVVPASAATGSAFMKEEIPTAPSTKVLKEFPYMYVGTFLTPSAPVSKTRASPASHEKDENTVSIRNKDSVYNTREIREAQTLDRLSQTIIPLSEPEAKIHPSGSIGTGDDSDIGSVASSMASGTSLGEQITHYCRATPGASLDPPRTGSGLRVVGAAARQQLPDLSVIISSDASLSDHYSESNHRGEDKEGESVYSSSKGTERGKVDEERSEQAAGHTEIGRRGIYGRLNQEAVRSAEALHLMERNFQEELKSKSQRSEEEIEDVTMLASAHAPSKVSEVSLSDCAGIGGGKRKKLLTRQEREARQLTRHRKRWFVSSSSDEEQLEEMGEGQNTISPVTSSHKDEIGGLKTELVLPKQENIVVAECDSSTGLGIVDSESICQRTQTLLEMKESFERTFGRSPRTKAALVRDRELNLGVNSTTSTFSKGLDRGDNCRSGISLAGDEIRDISLRRFKGNNRPVCEMQVVDSHLYVGYQNFCISVFDLEGSSEEQISEHPFEQLGCFYVTEINNLLTVIVGNGCVLTFCSASDTQIPSQDMGTPIRCILYSDLELFIGLETGEICVINAKTMEQRSRFICSDHSLNSMAVAQEGAMRLLCVAAQDGSISVINSRQGLLLRILSGHVQAVYSLQVDKSSVFSCSMDGMVLEQNLHTTTIEHVYKAQTGVTAIHLYRNYLLTAGIDSLIRCFDIKTGKLVQVNYGAGKGVVSKIIVIDNKLITGNMEGVVDVIDFNIDVQNKCPMPSCNLNFGHRNHLLWHQQQKQHFFNSEETATVII